MPYPYTRITAFTHTPSRPGPPGSVGETGEEGPEGLSFGGEPGTSPVYL